MACLLRITTASRPLIALALFSLALVAPLAAQAPDGYYDSVDASTSTALRQSLHEVIDDHQRYPYTSSATDTWDILELADEDPTNSGNILDVYRNASYPKQGGGNTFYNREHTWPTSYGFPNDNSQNYPFSDCHQLFLCNDSYNSSRSNKPFRYCSASCSENPTEFNAGRGGGSGVYPGNSNWTSGSNTAGTWEVWPGRRGDVARALLYLDVRYEGGLHGITGVSEPDLILTDDEGLIAASNTGSNESVAYMGMLSVLLQWHAEDPVDSQELLRNDQVFAFQGNRNPFVDHPEWVDCLFSDNCGGSGDITPPLPPTGLVATGADGIVDLDWSDNTESDLAGYRVYRSTTAGGGHVLISGLVGDSLYTDTSVENGTTYFYVVTAEDTSGNESGSSLESSATPQGSGGGPAMPWINEFHYDNAKGDKGEFVEVAGPAGLDLGGWQLLGYNGSNGAVYATVSLSGTIPDQGGCLGTLDFSFSGLQNGGPDGIALVDSSGSVVEFLSYEGVMTATAGPAAGLSSYDVGVAEGSSTPRGWSLQLQGTGVLATDFSWQGPLQATRGTPNTGQTFGNACGESDPPAPPVGLSASAGDGEVDLDWADNSEPNLAGYEVHRSTASGGPYTQVGGLVTASAYTDTSVSNGSTYYYVVTAVNSSSQTSDPSLEVSATPQDVTPPSAPAGLAASAGDSQVSLTWDANNEPDLASYIVRRGDFTGGPYTTIANLSAATTSYVDGGLVNDTTYFYVVAATDDAGNISADSSEVDATPTASGGGPEAAVWINEFHYDNQGGDKGEFVEVAGTAGTNLSGWTLVAYNGANGASYDSKSLSGTIPDQQNGFGTVSISYRGLQNGSPDGLALVDDSGQVVEFLSYEGSFTATGGPAAGMTSVDIGVSEPSDSPKNWSLQRSGTGSQASDFTWQAPQPKNSGSPNTGQQFTSS